MKTKRFFLRFILIFTVGANMYFVFKANSEEIEKLPLLTDLEVLADDGKFVRGPRGTNWEEYTTDCTYTKTSGTSVTIGIPGAGVTVSETQTATWTEYNKKVCGYGAGTCLASAGC